MAYLLSKETPRAAKVDARSAPASAASGTVAASFEAGLALLVPKDQPSEKGFRLVWAKGDASKARAVPAGTYQLRRYVITKSDEGGATWHAMATGNGREVVVREGQETLLDLKPEVRLKTNIRVKGRGVMSGGGFLGDGQMGLSLVKGQRRIVVRWKVLAGEKAVAEGSCDYG